MKLEDIHQSLFINGIECTFFVKDKKERIYINSSQVYTQYIEKHSESFVVLVFLKTKNFGEIYTKEEHKECFEQRDKLIDELNALSIGIEFVGSKPRKEDVPIKSALNDLFAGGAK